MSPPAAPRLLAALLTVLAVAGCSSLPRLEDHLVYAGADENQSASFVSATRVLSDAQSKAIVERLKRQAGDTDILTRHVAVSEAISGSPMVTGNRAILLEDGPATYAAMFAALRNAKQSINLSTYIFEPDEVGKQFADLLLEKRRQGVEVNLIYDSVGSLKTPKEFFEDMKKAGIRVVEFNPVDPLRAARGWQINKRNHRKLLIVDGGTAFVGGINISNVYSSSRLSGGSSAPASARAAARRGVDIKLILSSITDSWLAFHAGRSHYADLLAAGVKIYERQGQLLHAKTTTIDGVWSSVGTSNLDWRSFLHNDEVDAAILGREFAQQMEAMFARDLGNSQEIIAEQWRRRSIGLRLKEQAARLWEYLL